MNLRVFAFVCCLVVFFRNVDGACPRNLCDCDWSTPGFSVLGVNVGSVTISVCTVLPKAVEDLYHSAVEGFSDLVDNEGVLVQAAQDARDLAAREFTNVVNEVNDLEDTLGINSMKNFFSADNLLDKVDDVVEVLETTGDGIVMGLVLPIDLVKMFPELINDVNPDVVTDFVKERGEQIISWFTDAIMNAANGIGSNSCATCLVDNLNNGVISFEIGVDTGPGLSLTLIMRSTRALECLVNSFAELAKILHDSIPDEIEEGWEAVSNGLIASAEGLATASKAVNDSSFCNTDYTIPRTDFATSTGIGALDDFTEGVENMVNFVGADGPFGKFVQKLSDGVCKAGDFEGFRKFSASLEQFLEIVSFRSIEERILKGLFKIVNRMSENLATYRLMNFNLDTASCDPNNRACSLAIEYGNNYVSCLQTVMETKALAFSMTLSFGEHWVPPGITGFGGGFTCADLDCVKCVFGLENGGTVKDSLKFIAKEVFKFSDDDNRGSNTCSVIADCSTGGGTWDENICACRCSDGFIAGKNGCISCPKVNGKVCNDRGSCYVGEDDVKCCCLDGITTPDCS